MISSSAAARNHRFRHIVFAEPGAPVAGPPLNLAPPPAANPPADRPPAPVTGNDAFVRWLFRAAHLDVDRYRPETLHRRIPACLRALHAPSAAHARLLISRNPALLDPALGALLIGVTSLWRDPPVVAALASLLPGVAAGRSELRAWSAGCSHGAELYTVAVVLADLGLLPRAHLLGTDCRPDATRRAAAGAFDPAEARAVPPALLRQYFTHTPAGGYRAIRPLRSALNWRTADLLTVQEPGAWDLILCRNVTMYLTADAAASLWARFEASLRPGGLLVIGRAERPTGAARLSPVAPCIYKRSLG